MKNIQYNVHSTINTAVTEMSHEMHTVKNFKSDFLVLDDSVLYCTVDMVKLNVGNIPEMNISKITR
jgi:hypothetical protein